MKAIDICYTPLDLPEPPEYSVDEVKQWIIENTDELQQCVKDLCSRGMAAQEIGYRYPWRLVFAYWDEYGGWLNNFDKKFPELSKYKSAFICPEPFSINCLIKIAFIGLPKSL